MFASRFAVGLLLSCVGAVLITLCTGDMVDPATNTAIMRGNDTSVRVQGESGKISTVYFEEDDDDDDDNDDEQEDFGDDNEEVLSFEVESLQERNSAGAPVGVSGPGSQLKHAVEQLASQVFNLSPLDNTSTFQGIPVKNVNLTTTLNGPQAKLELMVFVFLRDGTVTFGNETFRVQSGTMKFNIKVSEWQFCGDVAANCVSQNNQQEVGQFLDLSLSIKSQAEEPEEVDDEQRAQSDKAPICVDPDDPNELDDDCPIIYNMGGNSEMVLNRGVVTDGGNYVPMPTGFPKFEPTGTINKRLLIFRIPKFNNTVIIDPSVKVGAPDKGQPGGAGHNNAASSLQFFALVLFLSIFTAQY